MKLMQKHLIKLLHQFIEKFPKWTPGIYDKIMENLTQIREDIKNGK